MDTAPEFSEKLKSRMKFAPTLTLISGNRALLDYCLTRGYSKSFVEFATKEADTLSQLYGQPEESSVFIGNLREKLKTK